MTHSTTKLPLSLLVETLTGSGEPTLVAPGGYLKPWSSLRGLCGSRVLTEEVRNLVAGIRDTGQPVDHTLPAPHRRLRLTGRPVCGPSGAVHAVRMHAVEAADPLPAPRPVGAFAWSSTSRLVELSDELNENYVQGPVAGRLTLTAPEVFACVEQLDDAMTLIAKALDPVPDDCWSGTATIRTTAGLRSVHLVMRSMPTPQQQSWRGLIHDVTATIPPAADSLEAVTLATAMAARGGSTAVALMDLAQARLISWITDPVPGVQWKGTVDNRDTPPPEDVARIFHAFEKLKKKDTTQVHIPGVRLRRRDGGWSTVDARATTIPAPTKPLIALIELSPAEDTKGW